MRRRKKWRGVKNLNVKKKRVELKTFVHRNPWFCLGADQGGSQSH